MPLEEEVLEDFYIFPIAADNLDEAVGEAQRMREILLKGNYEPTDETLE